MVRLFSLIGTVAAALSVTAVVPAILPIFDGGGLIPLLLATLLPLAVAAVARAAPARLAGYAAVGAILLAALPGGALGGLGSGAARLVTGSLPALASGPAFGIAVALTYLAAAIAVEAARTGRSALAPLAPGGALLALALLVGAGGLPQPRWAGALFVAAGAGALLAFQLRPVAAAAGRSRAPLARVPTAGPVLARRVLSGAAVTAAVGLLALPLGSALPGAHARRPYDLRPVGRPRAPSPQPGRSPVHVRRHLRRIGGARLHRPGERRQPAGGVLEAGGVRHLQRRGVDVVGRVPAGGHPPAGRTPSRGGDDDRPRPHRAGQPARLRARSGSPGGRSR